MKTQALSTQKTSTRYLALGWIAAAAACMAVLLTGTSSEAGWRRARRPVTHYSNTARQRPASRYVTTAGPMHNAAIVPHIAHGDIKPVQYHVTDSPSVHHH